MIKPQKSSLLGTEVRTLADNISSLLNQNPLKPCLGYMTEKVEQTNAVLEALKKREKYE